MKRLTTALLLTAASLMVGCGGPQQPSAKGTVTFNGEPLAGAVVTFHYEDGVISMGTTDAQGAFEMSTGSSLGAPAGTPSVSVTKSSGPDGMGEDASPEDMMQMYEGQGDQEIGSDTTQNTLPARYTDPSQSGIEVNVPAEGVEDLKIELTD